MVEKPSSAIGIGLDVDSVIEEVELCNHPSLPENFNGPGFLHALSGDSLSLAANYRVSQALAGALIRFEVREPSLLTFYAALPEGLTGEAAIERVSGTRAAAVSSSDLNKDDESFLRNDAGFAHRAVIQVREFLRAGRYAIRLEASETTGRGSRTMPRCEAYSLGLSVTPLRHSAAHPLDAECDRQEYIPEHLVFDEVTNGTLWYPLHESTVDVAYLDLAKEGEGPFLFHFSLQYDPRVLGVLGLSLSKYDQEATSFRQASLWRSPQDGLVQLLAIVEGGVYAVGIQSLTNTAPMFLDGGLGSQASAELGGKRLPQTCLGVSYSYLVASALPGDSRTLEGGALGLWSLLAGGDGLAKMAAKAERDTKLLDELGDDARATLGACVHDDLPESFPVVAAGFDRSLTLLSKTKPFDLLAVVVEAESILRVAVHTRSEKNQVSVYLLEHAEDLEALAWTKGAGNAWSFVHVAKPKQTAYYLKVVYDSLDEDDACPAFDFRVILKPVANALASNLLCEPHPVPPLSVAISGEDFVLSETYAFSSSFIHKVTDKGGDLEFDMRLAWPNADKDAQYYLDVESRSDVLTGQMTFTLLYEKPDKSLALLGRSHPAGSSAHESRYTQRLKLLDREEDLAEDVNVDHAVLRIRYPPSAIHLIDELVDRGLLRDREACHTFELSIRAELRSGVNEAGESPFGPSRLLRVRWQGDEVAGAGKEASETRFDPAKRLTAVLEFDRSMAEAYKLLKQGPFAALTPVLSKPPAGAAKTQQAPQPVTLTSSRLSAADPSVLKLVVPAGGLARGWCYTLDFPSEGAGAGPDWDLAHLGHSREICATSCLCNWPGALGCDEQTSTCKCQWPYTGADCSACSAGFTLDPATGACTEARTCKEQGGQETCNGHGQCEQVGQRAVCQCEPGFAHDGLNYCAKCADAYFTYPDCRTRTLALTVPDINCRDLGTKLPSKLWRDGPNRAGYEAPLQAPDGDINWGQRYRLSRGEAGRKLRTSSKHAFLVPETLVFRLHVDTSQSGVLAKYRLLNDRREVVLSSASSGSADADADGFVAQASEFAILHRPTEKDAAESPFTLEFEYKHEQAGKKAQEEGACPVVDIRVVADPLETARAALKCTDAELQAAKATRARGWTFDYRTQVVEEQLTLASTDESLYTHGGKTSKHFATVRYDIDVREGGNALTVAATYPFGAALVSLSLTDQATGALVGTERSSSLRPKDDGAGEWGGSLAHANITAVSEDDDMATFLEASGLAAGRYVLEIDVRRSVFLPTTHFPTCLSVGLALEYVRTT